jgi:alanine racemase
MSSAPWPLASLNSVRPTRALIDLSALAHNLREARRLAPGKAILGVVKADAYGHGAQVVGPALEAAGIDWFGVALVEEGIELRQAGVTRPILVLDGAYGDAYDLLFAHRLTPVVYRPDHLEALAASARRRNRPAQAHLKVDTGMGRLGVLPDQVAEFARAARAQRVELVGLCTHFANADLGDRAMADLQIARFDAAVATLREGGHRLEWIHLANSAATLERSAPGNLIRPGLMLYGHASSEHLASLADLRPALRWVTEIVQVKQVEAGVPVSYGGRFVTSRPSTLATLAVGYADGYRRSLSGKVSVLVRGRRVPVVGVITMDLCVADVTDLPEAQVGDEVTLLGRQGEAEIPVEELARLADTISYEIFCDISARVPRVASP